MDVIVNSFLLVALAEMGDKTQLLAFLLASRFQKPGAVMAGILAATILNHALAAALGSWGTSFIPESTMRWALAGFFLVFAVWILIPDKDEDVQPLGTAGAFWTTLVVFFFAEIGDKTQLATVALAANYRSILLVTVGTTLGMMFSDGLAVIFGKKLTEIVPMKWIRVVSAALFVAFAMGILFDMY